MSIEQLITVGMTLIAPMSGSLAIASQVTPPPVQIEHKEEQKQEEPEQEPPSTPPTNKEIVIFKTDEAFGKSEIEPMIILVNKESGFNNLAQNPNSTAFGIGQFLNSTWKNVGCVKTTDPSIQTDCMIKYIKSRYGTPSKALSFHRANNYY